MNWNFEKELERLIWYLLGFNDGEIGALSEPVVCKSNVCSWRGRRGLLPNNGLSDRKCYSLNNPLNNPLNRVLGGRPGHSLSEEREGFLRRLYDEGWNDIEIAERAGRAKTSIRRWRLRKRLSPNAIRGGQPVQKSGHKVKGETRRIRKKQIKKERKLSARKLAEEAETAIVGSLPSKDEVYQKVRNSPRGKMTTKALIKQGFGDVGHSRLGQGGRGDTVHKLGELVDEGLLALNTEEKDKILWIA